MSLESCTEIEAAHFLTILKREYSKQGRRTELISDLHGQWRFNSCPFINTLKTYLSNYVGGTNFSRSLKAVKMLEASFHELPLHINQKPPECRAVFKWRMEMAR